MKCPGLHCPGCTDGSPIGLVIAVGAVGALIWLADRALTAAAPVLTGAAPYIAGLGIPALAGSFAFVIIATRRERARLAWLRAGLPSPYVRPRVPVGEPESVPALPVASAEYPAVLGGSAQLSAAPAREPARVISLRLAPPVSRDASPAGKG